MSEKEVMKISDRLLSCSIFRVPPRLLKINPDAYKPEIVSIGPYHHREEHLQMMNQHKQRILGYVLARMQEFNVGYDDFFRAIEIKEKKIRECYSESIEHYNSSELIEMMILDGCFIIEVILVVEGIVVTDASDAIFSFPWKLFSLTGDLLRLENQIPLFVLQSLFELSVPGSMQAPSLAELIMRFFGYLIQIPNLHRDKFRNLHGEHLLDLFRSSFIPSGSEEAADFSDIDQLMIKPVQKLREANVKFKKSKTPESFLDIKFKPGAGVLEIPNTYAGKGTVFLLFNCVAYEQCYGRYLSNHFTAYVLFMGCLLRTSSDAEYLRDCNIIEGLGEDQIVLKLFYELSNEVYLDRGRRCYLAKVFSDITVHCSEPWNVWWGTFIITYFNSPWSFLSSLAALILLLLTFIQAFFAVYGYEKPPK